MISEAQTFSNPALDIIYCITSTILVHIFRIPKAVGNRERKAWRGKCPRDKDMCLPLIFIHTISGYSFLLEHLPSSFGRSLYDIWVAVVMIQYMIPFTPPALLSNCTASCFTSALTASACPKRPYDSIALSWEHRKASEHIWDVILHTAPLTHLLAG